MFGGRKWPLILLALLACDAVIGFLIWQNRKEHRHDQEILHAARLYGLDPALIKAVVWRESQFNSQARGAAGEFGLMQIREPAALEWAEAEKIRTFDANHLLSPRTNTLAGTWYLRKAISRYRTVDNPLVYALADYNAGRANVLKWNKGEGATNSQAFIAQIGFPGTRKYVESILARRPQYASEFAQKSP